MSEIATVPLESPEEASDYPFTMEHREFMSWIANAVVCKLMETDSFDVLQVVRHTRCFVAVVACATGEALIGHGTTLDFAATR